LDVEWFDQTRRQIAATRDRTAEELAQLGFEVTPSKSNFIFVRYPGVEGKELFAALRERGILVRRWDRPVIDQHLRISVGSDEEMDALVAAFRESLGK